MKDILDRCTTRFRSSLEAFPWNDRKAYGDWLAQTYYYVRHSTRLLSAAAARFPHDELGDALHYRFAAHIGEEKRHEQLAVHDLKQLGLSLDTFGERHSTRMFYEPQYYKVEHQAPAVLFGYILPLEAVGPAYGRRIVDIVTKAFGPKCASFLKVHAEEDEDHIQKGLRLLETVPAEQRPWVVQNLEQTTEAYLGILDEIARAHRA